VTCSGSLRCDCGAQLDAAMAAIGPRAAAWCSTCAARGRGVGLLSKLQAYELQEPADTVDANTELGLPVDAREYSAGAQMLADLGVRSVRCSPTTRQGHAWRLRRGHHPGSAGLGRHPFNLRYLITKRTAGHEFRSHDPNGRGIRQRSSTGTGDDAFPGLRIGIGVSGAGAGRREVDASGLSWPSWPPAGTRDHRRAGGPRTAAAAAACPTPSWSGWRARSAAVCGRTSLTTTPWPASAWSSAGHPALRVRLRSVTPAHRCARHRTPSATGADL